MMVQMLGVFAEFERAMIVERVIAGMERKAARGEWTGGSLPFGYRIDGEHRHLEPDETEAPLVREIFERYAERLEGSAALAKWLSERGYRTKNDRPFNPQAVLTILRNRAYLGEINYRGTSYPTPHEPLLNAGLFERAQAILRERGEDASLRRSNTSDYLLTGLLKCVRCGKRYIGACAHGNGGRYPYYVCLSRQRYGKKTCDADSLPAEELEQAVLEQIVSVLEQEPLVRQAIEEAFADLDAARPKREAELKRTDAELRKLHETLDRYFRAFEQQTMPEQLCGRRISKLTEKRVSWKRGVTSSRSTSTTPSRYPIRTSPPSRHTYAKRSKPATRPNKKLFCRRSSTKSASSVAPRSTPSSLCPRFDHRTGQCPRQESNLRTRFRKPLLYPLSYGGLLAQPCGFEPFGDLSTVSPEH
jgi:site-specific DNA recombinase